MGERDRYWTDDYDDDDELLEFISLLLLVAIPIILIYGLCVYFYKQKSIAANRRHGLNNDIPTARIVTHPSANDFITVYTVPIVPNYSNVPQPDQTTTNEKNCRTCSCREKNLEVNSINLSSTYEYQQSDPTLPSYSQVLSKI